MKQEKEVEEEVECWLVFLFILFASGFLLLLLHLLLCRHMQRGGVIIATA